MDASGGVADEPVEADIVELMGGDESVALRNIDDLFMGDETNDVTDPKISIMEATEAFMDIMMNNSPSQHVIFKENPPSCSLCEQDDTIPEDLKIKTCFSPQKLEDHETSIIHTGKERFMG